MGEKRKFVVNARDIGLIGDGGQSATNGEEVDR